ncbi:prion-inhibition and propagation-domain-containing protein [Aspergillus cavernicola]|uniref:Prion-inhibition and propagation-domain-containing protein n=1 Tax=Aspergillus cavernicola TaxID=176166 RepID=A0ABR4IYS1_9EURO
MSAQPAEVMTEAASRDLAQLWQAAVEDYEKRTGKSLQLRLSRSMTEVMDGMEGLSNKFKDFRDDRSKVAKVRTAFKANMWLIQNIVNTVQATTSVFPPTMPAGLIFTAFGQVMQTFADVSADYDKIMGFFDFTHRFFDRLSMIEEKVPALPPFQRCVTRVFSSMLKICSTAQEYAKEKRLKRWFETLIKGADGDLAAAHMEMEQAVNELSQAVGLATLRIADILSEVVQNMNGNVEFLVSKSIVMDKRTEVIQSNTDLIMQQNKELGSTQDKMTEMQHQTLEMMTDQSQLLNNILDYFGAIQMGQTFGKTYQTSLLKLGVVRLRLARWGQSIGLSNLDDVECLQQTKLSPNDIPKIKDILSQVLDLFADAERVSERFQQRSGNLSIAVLDPTKELDEDSASLHRKIYELAEKRQEKAGLKPKPRLTLYEEKSFTRLIEDIGGLVNALVDLFPETLQEQRKLCAEEVSEVNMTKKALPLLKEASDGQDKLLSEMVVKAIRSSSATTYTNSVIFSGPNSGFQVGTNSGSISDVHWGVRERTSSASEPSTPSDDSE